MRIYNRSRPRPVPPNPNAEATARTNARTLVVPASSTIIYFIVFLPFAAPHCAIFPQCGAALNLIRRLPEQPFRFCRYAPSAKGVAVRLQKRPRKNTGSLSDNLYQKNTPRACSLTSAEVLNGIRVVYPLRDATIILVGHAKMSLFHVFTVSLYTSRAAVISFCR